MGTTAPQKRRRGRVWHHGNRLMIRVSAGDDIVTGKRLYLTDTVPYPPEATAKQQREAWKIADNRRAELVAQVDQRRAAETNAGFAYAVDEWLRNHRPPPNPLSVVESLRNATDRARSGYARTRAITASSNARNQ